MITLYTRPYNSKILEELEVDERHLEYDVCQYCPMWNTKKCDTHCCPDIKEKVEV